MAKSEQEIRAEALEASEASPAAPGGVEVTFRGEYAGEDWFERHAGKAAGLSAEYSWNKANRFTVTMTPEDAAKLEATEGKAFRYGK